MKFIGSLFHSNIQKTNIILGIFTLQKVNIFNQNINYIVEKYAFA